MSKKSTNVAYWIFTLLLAIPIFVSGTGFLLAVPPAIAGIHDLGYPEYILRFLGLAKVLAVVAIVTGASAKLKDWAYAGLVFLLLGAAYSHFGVGEYRRIPSPLVMLLFLAASYLLWKRRQVTQAEPAPHFAPQT